MQDFPHHYRCIATANADQSRVRVASQGLENLTTDVPRELSLIHISEPTRPN